MGLTTKILRHERLRQYIDFKRNYIKGVRVKSPPIFVVGCGHSGTSLLLKMLNMHPHIHAVPFESRAYLKAAWKTGMARILWHKNTIAAGKFRWAEKTLPMCTLSTASSRTILTRASCSSFVTGVMWPSPCASGQVISQPA